MLSDETRDNLKASRGYGCLSAVVLGLAMGFVIILGNIMGDCEPGPGCHDNDGAHILRGFLVALPIVATFAVAMWLVAAFLRATLRPLLHAHVVTALLVAITLGFVWFVGYDIAFDIYFLWTSPGGP